jgi:superfamily II DNA helicase RecQ
MPEKSAAPAPLLEQLCTATQKTFRQIPCLWQPQVTEAILKHNRDVILISATGSGKTLTFWIPLLSQHDSIQIVCAPLNILGSINIHLLAKYGIRAVTVIAETATPAIFRVRDVVNS